MNDLPTKKILILSANPKNTTRLRLGEEEREIKEGLKRSKQRDQFVIETAEAVRPRDIHRAILDSEPQILHFSGHGAGEDGLVFEDDTGNAELVNAHALADLFALFNQVECVILNACYSQVQAEAIAQHIPYVIGMSQAIGDKAAIAFAVGFYDALGAGRPVEFAYKLGCAAMKEEGVLDTLTPILLSKYPLVPSPTPIIVPSPLSDGAFDRRYQPIIDAFSFGIDPVTKSGIIPFLGAGVNLSDSLSISPIEIVAKLAEEFNSSDDLIGVPCSVCPLPLKRWPPPAECPILQHIAKEHPGIPFDELPNCPLSNEQRLALAKMNLRLFSQYLKLMYGDSTDRLYQKIHKLCNGSNPHPNSLHHFLATLPRKMREKGYPLPYQLIVTTNYDDLLERAFLEADQRFDLVYYVAEGDANVRGRFKHKTYEEIQNEDEGSKTEGVIITSSLEERPLPFGKYPIILKLYGIWQDKFVITEDHHINYLSCHPITDVLPLKLLNILTSEENQFLLMGYSLNDWDLELILHRFSEAQKPLNGNFLIIHQSQSGSLEDQIWSKRKVGTRIKSSLEECVSNLERGMERLHKNPDQTSYKVGRG